MTGQFRRRVAVAAGALAVTAGLVLVPGAPAQAGTIAACTTPSPPSWWATRLQQAADNPNDDVPSSWGTSLNLARIVCRESDFDHTKWSQNHVYYGLGQMGTPAIDGAGISWDSYVNGSSAHPATYYQLLAALRYCKTRYHNTTDAWQHEISPGGW
ncbi:MAG: hypothetical protein JWN54_2499 [Mycobacterium sp.]|nr:hypothetical protein [Mycobacterium sp.]